MRVGAAGLRSELQARNKPGYSDREGERRSCQVCSPLTLYPNPDCDMPPNRLA